MYYFQEGLTQSKRGYAKWMVHSEFLGTNHSDDKQEHSKVPIEPRELFKGLSISSLRKIFQKTNISYLMLSTSACVLTSSPDRF